jgi:hypothetical protein
LSPVILLLLKLMDAIYSGLCGAVQRTMAVRLIE